MAQRALPEPTFWAGRRVLITGHTGFKGSWLAFWLAGMGARVSGLGLAPPTQPSAYAALEIERRIDSRLADIRDEDALDAALAAARPQIVFHLAAQPLVRRARDEPAATFDVNVMGTVRLLEALRASPTVVAAVVVTSDKCYAPGDRRRAFVESDPLGGLEPYAASKACAEIVVDAYRASYLAERRVAVATARAGNVIGGGDWAPDRLVTDLVYALEHGTSLNVRYPAATRPWQHVLDPLAGYLVLGERLVTAPSRLGRAYNFGPNPANVVPVEGFIARFERAWGGVTSRSAPRSAAAHEALHLQIDPAAARRALGWECRLDLDAAIDWTVEWYRTFSSGRDCAALTRAQIERYRCIAAPSAGVHAGV